MTQQTHEQNPSSPNPGDANVIDLRVASREHPRKPEARVEGFLLSEEGAFEMHDLYRTIDESGYIIKTLNFQIGETLRNRNPNIYSLFLHDDGAEGLTRPELIDLYKENPLVNAAMQAANKKHHQGDFQAQQLYTFAFRIFMNMVRYEWLQRTYDPLDEQWLDRASRLGDFHGNEMHLNLKPGFNRQTIIPRQHTPSDYLDQPL